MLGGVSFPTSWQGWQESQIIMPPPNPRRGRLYDWKTRFAGEEALRSVLQTWHTFVCCINMGVQVAQKRWPQVRRMLFSSVKHTEHSRDSASFVSIFSNRSSCSCFQATTTLTSHPSPQRKHPSCSHPATLQPFLSPQRETPGAHTACVEPPYLSLSSFPPQSSGYQRYPFPASL